MPANLCSSTCTCSLAITIPHIRMPKGRVFKKDVQFSPKVSLERWLKYGLITFSGVQTRSCHPENVAGTLILNLQGLHHAQSDGFDVVYEMVHCPPFLKDKCDMPKCGEKRGHYRRPGCPAPVPVKSLRQASSSQQYDEGLCQTPQQFFENPTFTMLDENGLPYVPLEAYPPGETFDGCPQMTDQEIEECFNSYWNRAPLDAGGQSSGHNGHPGSAQSSAAGQHAQQWQEQSSGPGGQQWESRSGTSSATQPSTETGHGLTQDEIEQMKQQPNWQDSLGTDSIKEQYLYDFM
ncbi:hypothetical protein BCR37DRAFT_383310 [Protomyces lactucae-debilis]|uniref:Uncharacterized protein n=1 Tax=Protomyces lactucae-debilis TaxID=2754530 RepID=A0A1Y2EYU8_PROLT|nr:uncharacterized protein BCR37DRAFT_383310 [Protomyces lactucae-debilis]ORY76667.1 hypothetical protein BCR37DRAFT_383310 [Protomyces lactucae-debilis]